ncbi:unnamed protein product, partial [marine sediment metagenome]
MDDICWEKKGNTESKKPVSGEKEKPTFDYIEMTGNRIYFYSGIETERILHLNKSIRNMSTELRRAVV